jgi:hypothetical protein
MAENGIMAGGDYEDDDPPFTVGWTIAPLGGGQYSYEYSFSKFSYPLPVNGLGYGRQALLKYYWDLLYIA